MAHLSIESVTKRFGTHAAVDDVSLEAKDGGFLAVLGPSGCGKTTLLRLIAGFETCDAGTITIGDRVVSSPRTHLPPEARRIGIVFQNYALWPHLNVAENIGYSLRVKRMATTERNRRVEEALALVGLSAAGGRDTASLSGGQRQRVALARCLVMEPDLVLLDEPLANLDQHLRGAMQAEFRAFQARTGTTMLYITHDQNEAMALADTVAVMDEGRLLQAASPRLLYREPSNPTVARFIGEGMVLPVEVIEASDQACRALLFGAKVMLRRTSGPLSPGLAEACFRPTDFAIARQGAPSFAAVIDRGAYQGGAYRIEAHVGSPTPHAIHLTIDDDGRMPMPGEQLDLVPQGGWLLP